MPWFQAPFFKAALVTKPLTRRFILQSLGGSVALPFLEAMLFPLTTHAANLEEKLYIQMFAPFGMVMHDDLEVYKNYGKWREFYIPEYTLSPLRNKKELNGKYCVYRGVYNTAGEEAEKLIKRDFPHTIESTGFFSGCHHKNIVDSIDQKVAQAMGLKSPLSSLQLKAPNFDNDPFYYNASYRGGVARPRFTDPVFLYKMLFKRPGHVDLKASVLDQMTIEIKKIKRMVASEDKARIDQHLEGVREAERYLEQFKGCKKKLTPDNKNINTLEGDSDHYDKVTRALLKLAVTALRCGQSRVLTLHLGGGHDPILRYKFLNVPGHRRIQVDLHELSHYRNLNGPQEYFAQFREVNKYHISLLSDLLSDLEGVTGSGGESLLESCLGVYGCGISQSHFHEYKNIPLIRFGRGIGTNKDQVAFPMKNSVGQSYNDLIFSWISKHLQVNPGQIGDRDNSYVEA